MKWSELKRSKIFYLVILFIVLVSITLLSYRRANRQPITVSLNREEFNQTEDASTELDILLDNLDLADDFFMSSEQERMARFQEKNQQYVNAVIERKNFDMTEAEVIVPKREIRIDGHAYRYQAENPHAKNPSDRDFSFTEEEPISKYNLNAFVVKASQAYDNILALNKTRLRRTLLTVFWLMLGLILLLYPRKVAQFIINLFIKDTEVATFLVFIVALTGLVLTAYYAFQYIDFVVSLY